MSSFKRSFLLVFDCSFSLCLHVFTGYWIFIRRQTLCVFGGFVKMFCTMIYKRRSFQYTKNVYRRTCYDEIFLQCREKKSIINALAGPSAKSVFSMQALAVKHTGHCFWIRTSVLFKHILIVPIGKETLRINGIVNVINKNKY